MTTAGGRATRDDLEQAVREAWPRAQAHWSSFLVLSRPVLADGAPSVAQIHLGTRQITLDAATILEKDLLGSVEALLAHEIGHHVRYPGNLAVEARMRLLERTLIPLPDYSVTNLFTDLLINERLGRTLEDDLVRVYRSFDRGAEWEVDPAFLFYLSVYEELWQRRRGELLGTAHEAFEEAYPAHRADAQLLSQELFHMGPNVYTQFLYFVSILGRYIEPKKGDTPESLSPHRCSAAEPSPDDWAEALVPRAAEREAIERALREGWITREQRDRLTSEELERRIHALPGNGTDDATRVPEVMAAYYRMEAERYLLRPPPVALLGEAVVPTTLDEWEMGDPVASIDWLATLVHRGDRIGAVLPLRRERIADHEGHDTPLWQPRTEIYLDVSGSMPDPRTTLNAMTLAAMILCVGTVRAGGWVRSLLYSTDVVRYWTFCRSETEMSRFLMHYIGAGTDFPFGLLDQSVEECRNGQPIRVILSDWDFDSNYQSRGENATTFARAAELSPHMILLLHAPDPAAVQRYERAGAKVVPVRKMDDFPGMAAALSAALFQERHHELA